MTFKAKSTRCKVKQVEVLPPATPIGRRVEQPDPAKSPPQPNIIGVLLSSTVLGENVVLGLRRESAGAIKAWAQTLGAVVYWPGEIRHLAAGGYDAETLKKVHMVKKRTGGLIIPEKHE